MGRLTGSRLGARLLAGAAACLVVLGGPVASVSAAPDAPASVSAAPGARASGSAAPGASASARLAAAPQDDAIGGAALGRAGIVVDRVAGVPPLPSVSAQGWLVADATTGEVLAGRYLPWALRAASTLKMLTAVALLRRLPTSRSFVATRSCVDIEGSRVGLVAGTRYTVDSLFESLLMVSGNDSANCLAEAAGGMHAATRAMNTEAKRLQARDTLARNTSGLDAPGQLSSPYDLALIARAGLAMPKFARYVRTLRSSINAPGGRRFEIYNHNKLLTRYRGTIGVKNGYTLRARSTYVGAATRNGHMIIVSLMKAEAKYDDAIRLFDWAFTATGRTVPVGRLVDPLAEEAELPAGDRPGAVAERADRSRDQVPEEITTRASGVAPPGRPSRRTPAAVATGAALAVCLGLRRRTVRRRRGIGPRAVYLRPPAR